MTVVQFIQLNHTNAAFVIPQIFLCYILTCTTLKQNNTAGEDFYRKEIIKPYIIFFPKWVFTCRLLLVNNIAIV